MKKKFLTLIFILTLTACGFKVVNQSELGNFKISEKYKKYLVQKGSITINGVSLTVANLTKEGFQIAIIPKTLELTNLINLKKKDLVNVEFDVLGKYIKRFIQ